MNIGKAIKDLREDNGMKQPAAAKEIGISQPNLSKIETGSIEPSSDMLNKIAKYYKIHPLYIQFLAIEESDIKKGKFEAWKEMSPSILKVLFEMLK